MGLHISSRPWPRKTQDRRWVRLVCCRPRSAYEQGTGTAGQISGFWQGRACSGQNIGSLRVPFESSITRMACLERPNGWTLRFEMRVSSASSSCPTLRAAASATQLCAASPSVRRQAPCCQRAQHRQDPRCRRAPRRQDSCHRRAPRTSVELCVPMSLHSPKQKEMLL